MNSAGVESLRETVEIFCTSEGEKHNVFIIAIGASEYSDKDWNLNYAAKDAQDIANLFAERKNDYSKIISTILIYLRSNIWKYFSVFAVLFYY